MCKTMQKLRIPMESNDVIDDNLLNTGQQENNKVVNRNDCLISLSLNLLSSFVLQYKDVI